MSQIREHNEEWAMDPEKIVVSDFSAGGHLACSLSVFWDREFVYGSLRCDAKTIRPDGMILCYPVITSGSYCHASSFEKLLGEEAGDERRTDSRCQSWIRLAGEWAKIL